MIGQINVIREIPVSEICFNDWTEEKVIQVCRDGIKGDKEALNLFNVWAEKAIAPPICAIKAFLGDTERLDGGTMGAPISQPEYVYIVNDCLGCSLASNGSCAVSDVVSKCLVLNHTEIGSDFSMV